ncbi:hypothetical protein E2C01_049583 [Portunus trituberculatus]|uniref:Uncharacterized protein n=1 Tax=Portunus trituberculatus TaxID=210409 RepID=A0A5B7G5Z7_PORTR|nr:hypothetical protein [Portunus trituberculatus]
MLQVSWRTAAPRHSPATITEGHLSRAPQPGTGLSDYPSSAGVVVTSVAFFFLLPVLKTQLTFCGIGLEGFQSIMQPISQSRIITTTTTTPIFITTTTTTITTSTTITTKTTTTIIVFFLLLRLLHLPTTTTTTTTTTTIPPPQGHIGTKAVMEVLLIT